MADKEVKVKLTLQDDYTDKANQASGATEDLKESTESLTNAQMAENVAFIANIEALDRFGGAISKFRGGLSATGLVSQDTAEKLAKVQGAIDMVAGAGQMYLVIARQMANATQAQIAAYTGLAVAAGGVALAYMAINAKSKEQRALLSVLTGATLGLAAAKWTQAAAEFSAQVASWGPAAPIIAGILTAAIGGGLTYLASLKASAQTEPGEVRTVEKTGVVLVHEGEQIGRVSEPERTRAHQNINISINGYLAPVDMDTLANKISQAIRWGA